MIVYIDIALLISALTNGFLLWLPGRILKQKPRWYRRVLGTVAGVSYGFFCFFLDVHSVALNVFASFLQICVVYSKQKAELTLLHLLSACLLSGILQAAGAAGLLRLLLFFCGGFLLIQTVKQLYKKIKIGKLHRLVTIGFLGKKIELLGFIDSGNKLPIAVINEKNALCLMGNHNVERLKALKDTEFMYTLQPCQTVSGEGVIPVFYPDELKIGGKSYKMGVGVNFSPMSEEMLLPQKIWVED